LRTLSTFVASSFEMVALDSPIATVTLIRKRKKNSFFFLFFHTFVVVSPHFSKDRVAGAVQGWRLGALELGNEVFQLIVGLDFGIVVVVPELGHHLAKHLAHASLLVFFGFAVGKRFFCFPQFFF